MPMRKQRRGEVCDISELKGGCIRHGSVQQEIKRAICKTLHRYYDDNLEMGLGYVNNYIVGAYP